jgi:cyclic-di-GMP-binding protein
MPGTKLTRTAEVYPGEVQRTKIDESRLTLRLIHDCAAHSHRIGIERHTELSSALALERMATQSSFDVTSNVDLQEVDNALNQARKEVAQRYDFKGSKASIDFDQKESKLVLVADDEFKLNALWEIVSTRLVRRNVPVKNLTRGSAQPAANSTVRQEVALQQGIPTEKARDIVKFIKDSKLRKVQAAIQGDQLRISSGSKDDLQEVMRLLREQDFGVALQFGNYRG